jgi:uncharacterized protein YndB with AHSA1/START domain
MQAKTKIHAEDGKQEIFITREFDLPLELLFKAYTEENLVAQWMGTNVIKLESKKQGAWHFQTIDKNRNMEINMSGVIHDIIPNSKIIRTFEMENSPFAAQIEYLDFEKIDENKSKLTIQIVYKSVEMRDQMLKLPFAYGLNMAHNRLQEIASELNN